MIHYFKGDATRPQGSSSTKVIVHIVNDFGGWGKGFVLALSRRWKEPEERYREWYRLREEEVAGDRNEFILGMNQYLRVEKDIVVVNMLAQKGNTTNLRALKRCLARVSNKVLPGDTIHMPRIGCGLGGRTWDEIEPIVSSILAGVDVYVYDLPQEKRR